MVVLLLMVTPTISPPSREPGHGIFVRVEFGVTYLKAADLAPNTPASVGHDTNEQNNTALRSHATVTSSESSPEVFHFPNSDHSSTPQTSHHNPCIIRPSTAKSREYQLDSLHRNELELFQQATLSIDPSSDVGPMTQINMNNSPQRRSWVVYHNEYPKFYTSPRRQSFSHTFAAHSIKISYWTKN